MKKYVLGGLVMVLLFCGVMSMIGCPTDSKEDDPTGGKVVAVQYRGTWKVSSGNPINIGEKTFGGDPAYTEGADLYIKLGDDIDFAKYGTFESDTSFKDVYGLTYTKQ